MVRVFWIGAVRFASSIERSVYCQDDENGVNGGIRVSINFDRDEFFADLADVFDVQDRSETSVRKILDRIGAEWSIERRELGTP